MSRGFHLTVFLFLSLFWAGCTQFENADMTERNTFVHFFSSETDYVGMVAELDTDGGFIVSGQIQNDEGEPDALIIKTDARGHKVWQQVIENSIINAIRPHGDGYILVGDSIKLNTGSSGVVLSELENTYARLLLMDAQGAIIGAHTSTRKKRVGNDTLTVDYHANALDINPAGDVIVLGSYRVPGSRESVFLSAFNPANISQALWFQPYEFDLDLFNCNALHVTRSSEIVWASRIHAQVGNLTREFVGISQVAPNSTYQKHEQFGNSDLRNHTVEDIQKSAVGYCVIGTYSETNGMNGNIFFLHVDPMLNVLSEKYIDGEELMQNNVVNDASKKTSSGSLDEGLAVVSTSDGFVLAGTITSTPTVGNGGTDLLLIKLDATGNLLWKKMIGGSGDETVTSIRETADHGLLICGTNTVNGLSTIMLVKTDRNGNLDN